MPFAHRDGASPKVREAREQDTLARNRLLTYVFAWTALVGTVFLGTGGVEGEDHVRASSALHALRARQAEFDTRVQDVRAGAHEVASEIPIVFARLEAEAIALPRSVDLDRHETLSAALVAYMDRLRAAREPLDRFAAMADFMGAPHSESSHAVPRPGDADRAATFQAELESAFDAIGTSELTQSANALLAGYESSFGERLDEAETYRICLFVVTALLLVRLVQSMRDLERRSLELGVANRTLEERVEERTRTLSATNRALETAVAEARRAERDARLAREVAEAASRTKSSFLANMSHEIRTPMTSILGFSERLLEEDLTPSERADAISTIRRNGEHLSQLVCDILDLSKIEAGRLGLEPVSCSPRRIVADLREAMAPRAEEKNLEFAVEWSGPAPEAVLTDPLRVEQVLFNLVGNAIKFTERGRILVRVGYESPSTPGGHGKLGFDVEDSGIGMDERALSRLFRPFVQGEVSTSRRFGGTGLGLSICSHLVAGLGGTILVSSRVGQGSVFSFHVDAGPLRGPLIDVRNMPEITRTARRVAPSNLGGMRVLLAEDGPDNQRLLRHLLTAAGASVSLAVDGEEAVRLALAARAHGRMFDVVLMDMQMPRLDGYAATSRLRDLGYDGPIVALTANAMAPDRERCLAAGCDDYCAKPVQRALLMEKVGRWRPYDIDEELTMTKRSGVGPEIGQDEGLLELVRLFVDELGADIAQMRREVESGNLDQVSMLAHRLKGAAGSYGFPEITRQAALLEKAVRSSGSPDAIACELASLEAICATTRGLENPRRESA